MTILFVFLLLAGIALILYPTVSNIWNSFHQTQVVFYYKDKVDKMDEKEKEQLLKEAGKYNELLAAGGYIRKLTTEERSRYEQVLKINDSGMMGYVEIPTISCTLPLYHGTEESVLQVALGHLEGSSLPVGGKSSHCVISGHRGLPSAKLFSNLDQLKKGDRFILHILNQSLVYEVDRIQTVLPKEIDYLTIEEGKDFCTLVTCTPYGINTHRLLVRGVRTDEAVNENETEEGEEYVKPWYQKWGKKNWCMLGLLLLCLSLFVRCNVRAASMVDGTISSKDASITIESKMYGEKFTLYILKDGSREKAGVGKIDEHGTLKWDNLALGTYLVVGKNIKKNGEEYQTGSVIVQIPTKLEEDNWQYDIKIIPKYEKINDSLGENNLPVEKNMENEQKENTKLKTKGGTIPQTGQVWWIVMVFSALSILFFAVAAILVGINFRESIRAEKAAREVADQLTVAIEQGRTELEYFNWNGDMPVIEIDGNGYIGYIEIPELSLILPVQSTWTEEQLKISPCRYAGSLYEDNLIIAGHNYARHFSGIKKLKQGAKIIFTDVDDMSYEYEVEKIQILKAKDVDILEEGRWDLTLFTCTFGGSRRWVVRCAKK